MFLQNFPIDVIEILRVYTFLLHFVCVLFKHFLKKKINYIGGILLQSFQWYWQRESMWAIGIILTYLRVWMWCEMYFGRSLQCSPNNHKVPHLPGSVWTQFSCLFLNFKLFLIFQVQCLIFCVKVTQQLLTISSWVVHRLKPCLLYFYFWDKSWKSDAETVSMKSFY